MTKKKEINQELIDAFYSTDMLSVVEKKIHSNEALIKKLWIEYFGEEETLKRNENARQIVNFQRTAEKLNKDIGLIGRQEIINLFQSESSIKDLEKTLNIDQRKIRAIWREEFGADAIKNRGKNARSDSVSEKLSLGKDVVEKIFNFIKEGNTPSEVAEILNISTGVVEKYVNKNLELKKISTQSGKLKMQSTMRKLRDKSNISEKMEKEISGYFYLPMTSKDIADVFGISSYFVRRTFKKYFSNDEYLERVEKQKPIVKKKVLKKLEEIGRLGSKPEIYFYNKIRDNLNLEVIHHDYDLLPPFEIDITIPELKIAIMWDGIGHFKPIFGESIFKQVVYRDKFKLAALKEKGWNCFVVKDLNSKIKKKFMNEKFEELKQLIISLNREDVLK